MVGARLRALAPGPAMDSLRIAFVADTFDEAVSGGTRSAVRFVGALRRQHDVVVLATGGRDESDRLGLPPLPPPLRREPARRLPLAFPPRPTPQAGAPGAGR